MDTTTVLEIIKMIDRENENAGIYHTDLLAKSNSLNPNLFIALKGESYGKLKAYSELKNHLQSFIDGQLNAAENQTVE
jgi:hypothetical protein